MKRSRILFAAAALTALGATVADGAPRLRELVTVSSDVVRIGDLIDDAGDVADIAVFRAPDLGQTGAVPLARIAEALRPHAVSGVETGGLSEVVVTRLSRPLTAKDIASRVARAVSGQYGYGNADNLAVLFDREPRVIHVEAAAEADLAVSRLSIDPRTGRFDISFELPGSAVARRSNLRFIGTVNETAETAVLNRSLRAGEVIKASDVTNERRPKTEVRGDGLAVEQTVGMAAKSTLRSGALLRRDDLVKPQIVQRNEGVTIHYQLPGISLTVRGRATEAGAMDDVVSVLNIQSNRTVQATVIGPGLVSIAPPRALTTAAIATPNSTTP